MLDLASIFITVLVPAILFGVAAGITVALEVHQHRVRRGGRTAAPRLASPGKAG
jgi:hypothetical protein